MRIWDKGWYKIVDRSSKKVIVSGKVINEKDVYSGKFLKLTHQLITFDDKHYFRSAGSEKYDVIKSKKELPFTQDIPESYKEVQWLDYNEDDSSIDVVREYGLDELDPEVTELVTMLNKLPDVSTVSSCSGHSVRKVYIDIRFKSFRSLTYIHRYLENHPKTFRLTTHEAIVNPSHDGIIFKLESYEIGDKAYNEVNKLSKYIEQILRIT